MSTDLHLLDDQFLPIVSSPSTENETSVVECEFPASPPRRFRLPEKGEVISHGDRKYTIGEKLGRGGFGIVYECSDEIRQAGLQLGHCVIEEITRTAQREKALAMMEHVSTHMRDYARDLIELWLDAWLYLERANTWEWILFNRPPAEGGYDMAEEEHLRALARYRMAGSNRMFRRYLQRVPVIEDARENRRTGRFERLRRIVEQAKRDAAQRSKSA